MQSVQTLLHETGLPCSQPLGEPTPLSEAHLTFEELVDDGTVEDGRDPTIRRALAEALAWHLDIACRIDIPAGLEGGWRSWSDSGVWPKEAHSPIFDFVATARGAGWIDEIARTARRSFSDSRPQVGHSDCGAKHVRFVDGRVRVVYDWDSLSAQAEEHLVGTAAATFTANPELHEGAYVAPAPDEVRAFVEEYSNARCAPLTRDERRSVHAAATYIVAYSARCEHSLGKRGNFTEALELHRDAYLSAT